MASLAKYFPITEKQKEEILAQYGKTKDNIKEDIQILRDWLKKQPHIPEIKDDEFLEIVFLRNKCRMEKTKIKIDNYFTTKVANADFFKAMDPCDGTIIEAAKYHYISCMPNMSPQNERIFIITKNIPSENHYDEKSAIRILSMIGETQLSMDYADCASLIVDTAQTTMAQMAKFEFGMLTKIIKIYFEAMSGRARAIHVINVSPAVDVVVNIVRPILPSKLRDRIIFHSKVESLLDYYPKECLPKEYGGTSVSAVELSKQMLETLQEEREYILKRNIQGTNEKLRIGKPHIEVELYGVEGTFKKITID